MVRTEDIIKQIMAELNTIYPGYKRYLGDLEEKADYPCFLINLGLENARVYDTQLIQKTLYVDIIYFNSNKKKASDDYIQKVKVKDNLESKLLNRNSLKVNKDNIKLDYSIGNADNLLNITLKLVYFNEIEKETIDYELIQDIICNYEIN